MKSQVFQTIAIGAALTSAVFAQNNQRQAVITGGGGPDHGKCTIEVVVDDVSQVEIRGAVATLRNVSGQPPQWRRFECTGAMPQNPANFRFAGVDGRGKQELVRNPANGGVAVVQIEDKDGGAEGYTFDITWDSRVNNSGQNGQYDPNARPGNGGNPQGYPGNNGANGQYDPNFRPGNGGNPPGYPGNNNGANGQYDPNFRPGNGNPQGYPGANNQGRDRFDNRYRDGSAEYRPDYRDSAYYRRYNHGFAIEEAVRICRESVFKQAVQRFRSNDIHFLRTAIDDSPGREDFVVGTVDVHRGRGEERFGFSCSVNFDSGQVRSAQLDLRPTP